ncbi:MAG: methyltransferase [Hyphomonadaceae bacterium]|nr:methyltransferase [Hyphomonadaceae bacterium]
MGDLLPARLALLNALRDCGYAFTTPTPATHARIVARPGKTVARDLRDVLGWSLPFAPDAIPYAILDLMRRAEMLEQRGDLFASRYRVSTLGADLVLHSAYPTTQQDAVFFGPDSYRFATFVRGELLQMRAIEHLVDIGAGAGAGALTALRSADIAQLTLTDINRTALDLARVNLAFAGRTEGAAYIVCDALAGVDKPADVIIANPPYIIDAARRAYRDGGSMHGAEVSLAWAQAAAEKLTAGGVLLLYTGAAIVNGEDRFKAALHQKLTGFDINYRELDPDVFGEELERPAYADVERIAVVGVTAMKR